ncbi:hypothetical protein HOLleu_07543 [Holothuria leucospilota]|uniref:Uncharacterized protein n=1 Tax=Holothuria leucospilota TaxID=206669 RepID=A0A9Q1CHR2_HOLLE|nr:hypothetical protein HOLleu_07543 [Holothuria leucospilota]
MVRQRILLFLLEVKGHLGSSGVKPYKTCLHDIPIWWVQRSREVSRSGPIVITS